MQASEELIHEAEANYFLIKQKGNIPKRILTLVSGKGILISSQNVEE
jgi:hypothetical protein